MINKINQKSLIFKQMQNEEQKGLFRIIILALVSFFLYRITNSLLVIFSSFIIYYCNFSYSQKKQNEYYEQLKQINNELFNSCLTKIINNAPLTEEELSLVAQNEELKNLIAKVKNDE